MPKHVRPEEEYAQTYMKWRRSVERNRAQGRMRSGTDAYYEQTYREWRETAHERSRRQREERERAAALAVPWKMRLKQRYARQRWLLFADSFGALVVLSAFVVFGVRTHMLYGWGSVPRSLTEATGQPYVEEIYKRNAEDAADVEQRRINRMKDLPAPFKVKGKAPEPSAPSLDDLKLVTPESPSGTR